jgi:hypothetical protein
LGLQQLYLLLVEVVVALALAPELRQQQEQPEAPRRRSLTRLEHRGAPDSQGSHFPQHVKASHLLTLYQPFNALEDRAEVEAAVLQPDRMET